MWSRNFDNLASKVSYIVQMGDDVVEHVGKDSSMKPSGNSDEALSKESRKRKRGFVVQAKKKRRKAEGSDEV